MGGGTGGEPKQCTLFCVKILIEGQLHRCSVCARLARKDG